MIQLCNRAIFTLREDGSTDFFQSDLLQEKLELSCRAAGLNETWIAEDISLAVEFTLAELGNDKVFTNSEIDAIVIKVLQEAGLTAVATHYKHRQENPEPQISFTTETISEIVDRYLHPDEKDRADIISKVSDAGKKLLLTNASPTLILELAKHYMDDQTSRSSKETPLPASLHSCPWLISRQNIEQKVSGTTAKMISDQIIKISGISRLFPAIRLEITFAKFAESSGLTAPVTDFILFSYLANLATALDDIIDTAKHLATALPDKLESPPIYLKFSDAPQFTEVWLSGNWEENKECFEELVAELKSLLKNEVFSYY
jgi:hypothetical protein